MSEIRQSGKILYARFQTAKRHYVYDTYSNAILTTPPDVWMSLHDPVEGSAAAASLAAAQAAGFLLPCHVQNMAFYESDATLEHRVKNAISQLTLELGEACNLRCHYCAFTYELPRSSHPRRMSFETARNAVDAFLAHSADAQTRTVSFWGGEPLVAFKMMRQVIEWIKGTLRVEPMMYAFTSNGTLLTEHTSQFLAKHDVKLTISIDGPEHIHDTHRRQINGQGTFRLAMAGLACLRRTAPEYYQHVRFNCVIGGDTSVAEVLDFFASHELLAGHPVTVMIANRSGLPDEAPETLVGTATQSQCAEARTKFLAAREKNGDGEARPATFYQQELQTIALRARTPLRGTIQPNGCCVPLLRKMVVRVNGDVYMCEQVPYMNALGNVNTGIAFDTAIEMVREYARHSLPACSQCWAMRLCRNCYRDVMQDTRWEPANRAARCKARRERLIALLSEYAHVSELDPRAFEYLKDYTFTFPV